MRVASSGSPPSAADGLAKLRAARSLCESARAYEEASYVNSLLEDLKLKRLDEARKVPPLRRRCMPPLPRPLQTAAAAAAATAAVGSPLAAA